MRTALLVPLIAILALCGCQARGGKKKLSAQERHRLYATEPDLVRQRGISCGMSRDAVEGKLGKPGLSITNTIAGRKVATCEYYTVTEAWYPPGSDDTAVFGPPPGGTDVSSRPRLDLTFVNGVLVSIGDHSKRTFTSTPDARGEPIRSQ